MSLSFVLLPFGDRWSLFFFSRLIPRPVVLPTALGVPDHIALSGTPSPPAKGSFMTAHPRYSRRRFLKTSQRRPSDRTAFRRRLSCEALENRRVLATFTVTNLDDFGVGSLRERIDKANTTSGPDVINFDPSLAGTIVLANPLEMLIEDNLTITGPGSDEVTIDASVFGTRVFWVEGGSPGNDLNVNPATISRT